MNINVSELARWKPNKHGVWFPYIVIWKNNIPHIWIYIRVPIKPRNILRNPQRNCFGILKKRFCEGLSRRWGYTPIWWNISISVSRVWKMKISIKSIHTSISINHRNMWSMQRMRINSSIQAMIRFPIGRHIMHNIQGRSILNNMFLKWLLKICNTRIQICMIPLWIYNRSRL